MDHVRFAVVGTSNFGTAYVKAIMTHPDAILVAVCDIDEARARSCSERFNSIPYYTDYGEMLRVGGFDCVCIVTPDHFHCSMAIEALRAGYHVMCEKPLAPTNEECLAIVRAAEQSDKLFMTCHVVRKSPAFIKAKELIEAGEIGELFYVESEYAHDYEFIDAPWRRDKQHLRHGIVGGGCHAIDILRWIAGDPQEVIAISNRKVLRDWPVDDTTVAIMRFPRGVLGRVFCSIGAKRKYTMRSCFYGTKGTVICDNNSTEVALFRDTVDRDGKHTYPEVRITVDQGSHKVFCELEEMIDAIITDGAVECDAMEGARTVAVALAAVDSSEKGGAPVRPRYPRRRKKRDFVNDYIHN